MIDVKKQYPFQEYNNSLDLKIFQHGYTRLDSEWNTIDKGSLYNRLYFVFKGGGTLVHENHTVDLRQNMMYLIPVSSTYRYQCSSYLEKYFIHFRFEIFDGMDLFEDVPACLSLPADKEAFDYFRSFMKKDFTNIREIVTSKSIIFKTLSGFLDDENIEKYVVIRRKYSHLLQDIKKKLSHKLDISDLDSSIFQNREKFLRNFKKDLGVSFKQYMIQQLLLKSQELLVFTDMRIKEISYKLDFDDEFYFSNFFKSKTGLSPVEFRKNVKS